MSRAALAVLLAAGVAAAQAPVVPMAAPPPPDPFKAVPPVRAWPRPGHFQNPPTGPGYYSAADQFAGAESKALPKYPYPRNGAMQFSFFDADFRYLDDPKNTECDAFDALERIRVGDDFLFSTGGELRSRYHNEFNSRLTQTDNSYNLSRVWAYTDLWYKD